MGCVEPSVLYLACCDCLRYWNRLELYCRKLTGHYDEVTIITGPLFLPERRKAGEGGKERKYVTYEVTRHCVNLGITCSCKRGIIISRLVARN